MYKGKEGYVACIKGRLCGMYKGKAVWHLQKEGCVACIKGRLCGIYKGKAVWHL